MSLLHLVPEHVLDDPEVRSILYDPLKKPAGVRAFVVVIAILALKE
jgi:hypothetical protein